jgi:hypothetical protein
MKTRTLSLEGSEGQVEIAIKNREVQELLGVPVQKRVAGDVDFHAYYRLAAQQGIPQLIPHDIAPPQAPGVLAMSLDRATISGLSLGGVCPPTAFNGKAPRVPVPQATLASAPAETLKVLAKEEKAAKQVRRRY